MTREDVLCALIKDLTAQRDKLRAFKDYVHGRLDAAGVPADPESPHRAEGCRIGGRLDVLIGERDALRATVEKLTAENYSRAHDPHSDLLAARERVAALEAALKPFADAWLNRREAHLTIVPWGRLRDVHAALYAPAARAPDANAEPADGHSPQSRS